MQNVCKSVERAGLEVADIVLEPLASSRAVLTDDEREMGVCLVDVGGGTSDMALFFQGGVRKTAVIGVGGQSVTSDIAICMRTSWGQAERLKMEHGLALLSELDDAAEDSIDMSAPGRPQASVSRFELTEIIEARMEELFRILKKQVDTSPYGEMLSAGIVLTGGGALIEGAELLAERIFKRPVRLSAPKGTPGIGERVANPMYSTAVGLALMAADDVGASPGPYRGSGLVEGRFESVAGRMREWFNTLL
jgi:cell division protein FtsA